MNSVKFEQKSCEQVRSYLDSYLNDELLVETNHQIENHLERCPGCAATLESRVRVRRLLQRAVKSENVPAALEAIVRARLREQQSANRSMLTAPRLALAATLAIVVCFGAWVAVREWNRVPAANRTLTAALNPALSDEVRNVLNIGLSDHVHCAIESRLMNEWFDFMFNDMRPEYNELIPLVQRSIGSDYELTAAHTCFVGEREFTHLIMEDGRGQVSLVITRKNGAPDSLGAHAGAAATNDAGAANEPSAPLYTGRTSEYAVTGFETNRHLAFILSNLPVEENKQFAQRVAPAVHKLLTRLERVA